MATPYKNLPRKGDETARKERFLVAFRKYGFKSKGLEEAGITYKKLKDWLSTDEAFAKNVEDIADETDLTWKEELEESGIRRALSRSDKLLMFFLQKLDPSYNPKTNVDLHGSLGVTYKENLVLDDL